MTVLGKIPQWRGRGAHLGLDPLDPQGRLWRWHSWWTSRLGFSVGITSGWTAVISLCMFTKVQRPLAERGVGVGIWYVQKECRLNEPNLWRGACCSRYWAQCLAASVLTLPLCSSPVNFAQWRWMVMSPWPLMECLSVIGRHQVHKGFTVNWSDQIIAPQNI